MSQGTVRTEDAIACVDAVREAARDAIKKHVHDEETLKKIDESYQAKVLAAVLKLVMDKIK